MSTALARIGRVVTTTQGGNGKVPSRRGIPLLEQTSVYILTEEHAVKIGSVIMQCVKKDGGQPVAIAVVGAEGQPIFFIAMNGVIPAFRDEVIVKAATAARFRQATANIHDCSNGTFGSTRNCFLVGGVPIIKGGQTIGAVAVSGRGECHDESNPHIKQNHDLALTLGLCSSQIDPMAANSYILRRARLASAGGFFDYVIAKIKFHSFESREPMPPQKSPPTLDKGWGTSKYTNPILRYQTTLRASARISRDDPYPLQSRGGGGSVRRSRGG